MTATRTAGTDNDAYFDDLFLSLRRIQEDPECQYEDSTASPPDGGVSIDAMGEKQSESDGCGCSAREGLPFGNIIVMLFSIFLVFGRRRETTTVISVEKKTVSLLD